MAHTPRRAADRRRELAIARLAAARSDPVGFIEHEGTTVIDEAQRAPGLGLAIKARVDRDPRAGQFLLTGSADIFTVPEFSRMRAPLQLTKDLPSGMLNVPGMCPAANCAAGRVSITGAPFSRAPSSSRIPRNFGSELFSRSVPILLRRFCARLPCCPTLLAATRDLGFFEASWFPWASARRLRAASSSDQRRSKKRADGF